MLFVLCQRKFRRFVRYREYNVFHKYCSAISIAICAHLPYTQDREMTQERTAPRTRLTEHYKARARLPLLGLLVIVLPGMAGVRSVGIWIVYAVFAILYSLWTLRLTAAFSDDRRLGYVLCLTDAAVLLPLLVWNSGPGLRILIVLLYGGGLGLTYLIDQKRSLQHAHRGSSPMQGGSPRGSATPDPRMLLERAVSRRLSIFAETGTRFAVVMLRIVRFEEAASYYGPQVAAGMLAAVGRRGVRFLGPEAEMFALTRGRIAFVFDIEYPPARAGRGKAEEWSDPHDVESVAMCLGRKVSEHLIEGRKVECVVGWASAPVDGLTAGDLLYTAEHASRSTEVFRRVSGSPVSVRVVPSSGASRRAAPVGADDARTAVG